MLETWETLREAITETDMSEVLLLDGGHYLHFERKQELVEKVKEWVRSVEEGFQMFPFSAI